MAGMRRLILVLAGQSITADFVIACTVGARDRVDGHSYPQEWRDFWRWPWPYFGSEVDIDTFREGALAVDIFDGATRQPVWHGRARLQLVEVGRQNGLVSEISKGLEAGQQLVLHPSDRVADGVRITPRN